jgi:hypothetical protein
VSSFQVTSEELTAVGGLITAGSAELDGASGTISGGAGACLGTPAAFAYDDFVTRLTGVLSEVHQSVESVGTALREAATAYQYAESANLTSFGGPR